MDASDDILQSTVLYAISRSNGRAARSCSHPTCMYWTESARSVTVSLSGPFKDRPINFVTLKVEGKSTVIEMARYGPFGARVDLATIKAKVAAAAKSFVHAVRVGVTPSSHPLFAMDNDEVEAVKERPSATLTVDFGDPDFLDVVDRFVNDRGRFATARWLWRSLKQCLNP